MNSGQAFRNVKSMGTSGTNYVNIELENSKAVLKEASNNKSTDRRTAFGVHSTKSNIEFFKAAILKPIKSLMMPLTALAQKTYDKKRKL